MKNNNKLLIISRISLNLFLWKQSIDAHWDINSKKKYSYYFSIKFVKQNKKGRAIKQIAIAKKKKEKKNRNQKRRLDLAKMY